MRKGVRVHVSGHANQLQCEWAFMQLYIVVDHLVDQGAVLAADQPFSEICPLVSREKVEGDPDKGLVIDIPVFDDFFNGRGGRTSDYKFICLTKPAKGSIGG